MKIICKKQNKETSCRSLRIQFEEYFVFLKENLIRYFMQKSCLRLKTHDYFYTKRKTSEGYRFINQKRTNCC